MSLRQKKRKINLIIKLIVELYFKLKVFEVCSDKKKWIKLKNKKIYLGYWEEDHQFQLNSSKVVQKWKLWISEFDL